MSERLAFVSFLFLLFLAVISLIAPYIVPYDPLKQDLMNVMAEPKYAALVGD